MKKITKSDRLGDFDDAAIFTTGISSAAQQTSRPWHDPGKCDKTAHQPRKHDNLRSWTLNKRRYVGHPTQARRRRAVVCGAHDIRGLRLRLNSASGKREPHSQPIWKKGGIIVTHRRLQLAPSTVRTGKGGTSIQNELLASMIDSEFRLIRPHLEHIQLPSHKSLCEPDELFQFAYFPNTGLISIVVVLSDGRTVEAALIGKEGITGLPAIAGRRKSALREVVQISGEGFRIKIAALRSKLKSAPILDGTLKRYASVLGMQVAQTAACNRLHEIDRRLARWFLMARDRVDSGLLHITQDFLATMLGTDRSTVSLAAGTLQEMNVITYSRGIIKILDRERLETYACECYRAIRDFNTDRGWV